MRNHLQRPPRGRRGLCLVYSLVLLLTLPWLLPPAVVPALLQGSVPRLSYTVLPGHTRRPGHITRHILHTRVAAASPTYEIIDGVETLYESPVRPKGVLLVFHGCSHGAIDWWPSSPFCKQCIGLPEEIAIRQQALARGYAVVAMSSVDRGGNRCWDTQWPPQQGRDLPRIGKVVQQLQQKEEWFGRPFYALGASSGGAFALRLALHVPLAGVCAQIMGVQPAKLKDNDPQDPETSRSWQYPPTLFVHMMRDNATAQLVAQDLQALASKGVVAAEIRVPPLQIAPSFFWTRIPGISQDVSSAIHESLLAIKLIDARGFLTKNPRTTFKRWQAALLEAVPETRAMRLQRDESPIFEELNVAWAGHELVSDTTNAMLGWFEDHSKRPLLGVKVMSNAI